MSAPLTSATRRSVERLARRLWPAASLHLATVGLAHHRVEIRDGAQLRALETDSTESDALARLHADLRLRARLQEDT